MSEIVLTYSNRYLFFNISQPKAITQEKNMNLP